MKIFKVYPFQGYLSFDYDGSSKPPEDLLWFIGNGSISATDL